MKTSIFLLLCGLLVACVAMSNGQDTPGTMTGYVSRAQSKSDFDINGARILCREGSPETAKPAPDARATSDCPSELPYVGEPLVVHYTERDTASNVVYATRIEKQPQQVPGEISGAAVIEVAPVEDNSGTQPPGLIVQADGYRIHITGNTSIKWKPPFQSLTDVKAGSWIKFKGRLDAGGVLGAASAEVGPNTFSDQEAYSRKKSDYDPSAIPADAKQNRVKDAFFVGWDAKKFPPYKDAESQVRIEKIGNSLVPAYQRTVPDSDPAKADFRFQLIDTRLFRNAMTRPSGTVLVPRQVVERLLNDSQLAAVLADGIACILERQDYRTRGRSKAMDPEEFALVAPAQVVPHIGYGVGELVSEINEHIAIKAMEQRGRVSLALMRDAGYDILQAPTAWMLLGPDKPLPLSETELNERAAYLYRFIGAVRSGRKGE